MPLRLRLLGCLLVLACGAETGTVIGPLGGRVEADDGSAWLDIPAGALARETHVTFEARQADRAGFVSGRTWSIDFGGERLAIPATISLPCARCADYERLGERGEVGVIPIAEGSELAGERFQARVSKSGIFGVTTCAHRYCLSGRVTGSELRLTWEGEGATIDGAGSPLVVPVTVGAPPRTFTIRGPDGDDELIAVLDPLAPPASTRALETPSGSIRLLWEPSLFAGVLFHVERRACGRVIGHLGGRVSGVTDEQVNPGTRYHYRVGHVEGANADLMVEARPSDGECVVRPETCELVTVGGVEVEATLAIEPSGAYRLELGEGSQSLQGFAEGLRLGDGAIAVTGVAGAEGERLLWIQATREDGATCRAPLWLRAADVTAPAGSADL